MGVWRWECMDTQSFKEHFEITDDEDFEECLKPYRGNECEYGIITEVEKGTWHIEHYFDTNSEARGGDSHIPTIYSKLTLAS
jgi:hypothetical protein